MTSQDGAGAMDAMWLRFRDRILERLQVVEAAVDAVRSGTLSEEQRGEAQREAHRLAGSLGTFGMEQGTEPARALEHAFAAGALEVEALELHARELRRMIEAR